MAARQRWEERGEGCLSEYGRPGGPNEVYRGVHSNDVVQQCPCEPETQS
jgi:hypothetical protein